MNSNTDQFLQMALKQLQADHEKFAKFVARVQGTDVGDFVNRALDWKVNKPHSFYELFHEVIACDEINFMASFRSWVVNSLLDDSSFKVIWVKNEMNKETGRIEQVSSDPSDLNYRVQPIVIHGYDDGCQDPTLLMAAMDRIERNCEAREALHLKLKNMTRKFPDMQEAVDSQKE